MLMTLGSGLKKASITSDKASVLTLLTGGARSGKSSLAIRLAESDSRAVHYLATAEALDKEMADRIERHQRTRSIDWVLHEEPIDLFDALKLVIYVLRNLGIKQSF